MADTGLCRVRAPDPMSWKFSHFASSLIGLLREPDATVATENRIEEIRDEMLESIFGALPDEAQRPPVLSKVLYARDAQSLWYQRSDLMSLLSEHHGESWAREKIDRITQRFNGLLPAAQLARSRRHR